MMHLELEVIYSMNYFDEEQNAEVVETPAEEAVSPDPASVEVGEPTEEVKTDEAPAEEGGDQNVSEN